MGDFKPGLRLVLSGPDSARMQHQNSSHLDFNCPGVGGAGRRPEGLLAPLVSIGGTRPGKRPQCRPQRAPIRKGDQKRRPPKTTEAFCATRTIPAMFFQATMDGVLVGRWCGSQLVAAVRTGARPLERRSSHRNQQRCPRRGMRKFILTSTTLPILLSRTPSVLSAEQWQFSRWQVGLFGGAGGD